MNSENISLALPARVRVGQLLESRYDELYRTGKLAPGTKPLSWDQRTAGIDTVHTDTGEVLKLQSTGGQAPPKAGWILMLTEGNGEKGYSWTLYGIPPG